MSQQRVLKQINQRIKQSQKQGDLIWLQLDSICIRQFTKETKALLEACQTLEYLTLNDCELNSLNNFPKLDNLSVLQLSNNKIQDDELFHLLKNSHISHLMIDQNRLKSIQKVSILRQLPNLQQLEIAGNRIGESDFYREEFFDRIPQLKIIDCHDRGGNIAIDSQSESEAEGDSVKALNNQQEANLSNNQTTNLQQNQKCLLDFLEEDQSLPEEENNDKDQSNHYSLDKDNQIINEGSKKRKLGEQETKHSRIEKLKTSAFYQESSSEPNFIQYNHNN